MVNKSNTKASALTSNDFGIDLPGWYEDTKGVRWHLKARNRYGGSFYLHREWDNHVLGYFTSGTAMHFYDNPITKYLSQDEYPELYL